MHYGSTDYLGTGTGVASPASVDSSLALMDPMSGIGEPSPGSWRPDLGP